jgi:hypothetical protein
LEVHVSEENKRGGGPRSREGRARVSLNALRHGLTSLKPQLLGWESATQFRELREALIAELEPEGVVEAILVDRIVWCAWRLRRAARVELLLLTGGGFDGPREVIARWVDSEQDPPEPEPSPEEVERDRERREAEAMVQYGRDAGLLTRYETTIERSMYRALCELRTLQERRPDPKHPPGFKAA